MENRSGLIVGTYLTEADGHAERDAALLMVYEKRQQTRKRITLGADKAYDTQDFVKAIREMNITPHVAQNTRNRNSAIDERTTRHTSYQISQANAIGSKALRMDENRGTFA